MSLQEQFRAKVREAEALQAQHPTGMPADALKGFTALVEEIAGLKTQITQSKEFAELKAFGAEPGELLPLAGTQKAYGAGQLEGFQPSEEDEGIVTPVQFKAIKTKGYKASFRRYLQVGINGLRADELKTLSEGSDTAGGFLVPEEMVNRIIQRKPTPTRVQGRVSQMQTSRDSLVMPKVVYATDDIYSTGIRVTWTGEIPASSTAHRVTDPVFGQTRIPIFTAMMSMPITNDMVEDAMFPLIDFVSGKFAETVDILKDDKILNGTGTGQPMGILVNPGGTDQPKVIVSGSAAAYTADGLMSTAYDVPEQYDENCAWLFNKVSSLQAIAKLKDSQNRYLFGIGYQDSGLANDFRNRNLLGYPVVLSGLMPNVGASTYPAIFGDLSGYTLVNRIGFSIQVLRELYAETNQIVLLGRVRFGGELTEPWKLRIHQMHT